MYTKKNGRMTYKTNRRPNFKRNNGYSSKGRNKGNVTQQYNKYLKLAKDTFSAGDRIQAEYYYQFTDHYYRLMQELGINLDDQDNLLESRDANSENIVSENEKEDKQSLEEDIVTNKDEDNVIDDSIESIPFISEPVKKKRTRSSK
jgi:high-affinity Fe2+/Pb2+ permease